MEAFESARWLRLTAWPLLLAPKICRILAPKGEFRYQLVISSTLKLRNPWIAAIGTLTLDFSMRFRLSPMGASRRAVNSEAAGQRATVLEHLNARHRGTTPNHSEKSWMHQCIFCFSRAEIAGSSKAFPAPGPSIASRGSDLQSCCGNMWQSIALPESTHLMLLHNPLVCFSFPWQGHWCQGKWLRWRKTNLQRKSERWRMLVIQSRHLRSLFSFASFASHFFHLQEGLNIDQVLDTLLYVRKRHGAFLVCYMRLGATCTTCH